MSVGTQDEPEFGVFYAGCTLDSSYCDVAIGHLRMKSLGDPCLKHYYAGKAKKRGPITGIQHMALSRDRPFFSIQIEYFRWGLQEF